MSSIGAIILAAGQGSRFGRPPKLLSHLQGKPLVRHVAEAVTQSIARPVIVVTGHEAGLVEDSISELPMQFVRNALFSDGMSTSLKLGFATLPERSEAAIVLLGDMPLVTARLIDDLINAWEISGKPAALIPTVKGQRGNPVVLSRALQASINSLSGDRGAGMILKNHPGVVEWPLDDKAVLQDVDTPEALREIGG
jgi:molybdenum cofactor cytidylyltransferase